MQLRMISRLTRSLLILEADGEHCWLPSLRSTATRAAFCLICHVVAKAKSVLTAANVAERCEIVGGDVFKSIPKEGDACLIKSVLMDESDESVISILKRCRSVMSASAHVIVIEHLLTPPNQPDVNYSDMTMMVMTGGRERTQKEFEDLFAAAGFRFERAVATRSPFTLLIGSPSRPT